MRSTHDRRIGHAALLALSFVLCLLVFAPPALAGPPIHQREAALDIEGLNHACGTAVDSEGDVYVSSAGAGKIEVFAPSSHATPVAEIADGHEPCALAVNSKGELFVSEKALGDVVRYRPNAYPFSGTPTYGAAEPIDSSGEAQGVAIDPTDDGLYIAEGEGITAYAADGTAIPPNDEVQEVFPAGATGGTFTLGFEGAETPALPFDATHLEVEEALEALPTIGAGNVSVAEGDSARDHIVTFEGALANTALPLLEADTSGLVGPSFTPQRLTHGYAGQVGKGLIGEASGVAVFTYVYSSEKRVRYVYATDRSDGKLEVFDGEVQFQGAALKAGELSRLRLRRKLSGPAPGEGFGFGPAGAYLAIDPGNGNPDGSCDQVAEQACTADHLLVYDGTHNAIDELDASGEFVDRFTAPGLEDAEPTAMAVDRSGGPTDGTIYATSGSVTGAKAFAFGPLVAPGRRPLGQDEPLEPPSQTLPNAAAVASDSHGDLYAAAGKAVRIYGPTGAQVTSFTDEEHPYGLAVDSRGNVYVIDAGPGINTEVVTYYAPSSYPPTASTAYVRHEPIFGRPDFPVDSALEGVTVNPDDDRVFVASREEVAELGSAEEGSLVVDPGFAGGLRFGLIRDVAVCGRSGEVFVANNANSSGQVAVVDETGTEVLARITGAGSPGGLLPLNPKIAIDQANCHVLVFDPDGGKAREYDSRGGFVAEFGEFSTSPRIYGIAIDSACAVHRNGAGEIEALDESTTPTCAHYDPGDGRVYVAHDEAAPGTPDIWAFAPLSYGDTPLPTTGGADEIGAGRATLHGAVNPLGFEVEGCRFEYLTDAQFQANIEAAEGEGHEEAAAEGFGFAGASVEGCAETPAQIGKGAEAVAVHTTIEGLDPEGRYRYRLAALNKYGEAQGHPRLFGPPLLEASAPDVLYDEAVLHAGVEPSGLATSFHFECGPAGGAAGEYDRSTSQQELAAEEGSVALEAGLGGLAEGATYHCRAVAVNEAGEAVGEDQEFTTLARPAPQSCSNAEYRTGHSAQLPDCRAYELVSPAQTGGLSPGTREASGEFNDWLTVPRGPLAGERLSFFTQGTIEGFEGSGFVDGYLSQRGPGDHPASGWTTTLSGPSFDQAAGIFPGGAGVSADQLYSAWIIADSGQAFPGALTPGRNIHTPVGFEGLAIGDLGADTQAPRLCFLSSGGVQVIFSSKAHLEPEAPPAGTMAIYDRPAGSPHATVLSLKPGDASFGNGQNAGCIATSEDGSSLVFAVGAKLYERRAGETLEVAEGATFAGISPDGSTLTYTKGGAIFSFDATAEPPSAVEVAQGTPVDVSPDGSRLLFTSEAVLTGSEENENEEAASPGAHNLYLAAGGEVRFVAVLDQRDFEEFNGLTELSLGFWAGAISEESGGNRAISPTRSTPDGEAFAFQSHARLTAYDNEGIAEVYRYAPDAAGERVLCVSCSPAGAPPAGEPTLQDPRSIAPANARSTLIPNVTDDGEEVFFQTPDRLLPEDANEAQDVYEWRARGTTGPGGDACARAGGCLALISSGQGEGDSFLYSMSAAGHDVFFRTEEKLVEADVATSKSIYDARVGGGIPEAAAEAPCQGDACQGGGSEQPALPSPATTGSGNGNEAAPITRKPCGKGRHRVKGRCVPRHHRRRHHRHRRTRR